MANEEVECDLLVVDLAGAGFDGESYFIPKKSAAGLLKLFSEVNYKVCVIFKDCSFSVGPGLVKFSPGEAPFGIIVVDDIPTAIQSIKYKVFSGLLSPTVRFIWDAVDYSRSIPLLENNMRNRMLFSGLMNVDFVTRIRILVGAVREELFIRKIVRRSAGIECNGFPAANSYSSIAKKNIMYLDSRVDPSQTCGGPSFRERESSAIRVAFSGRLIAQKGFDVALQAFIDARNLGFNGIFEIFGDGELRELIPKDDPNIIWHREIPFNPDWIDAVSSRIDVMLIPHTQGDPSGTYMESFICGVPIISFDNDSARNIIKASGGGWVISMGNLGDIVSLLLRLASNPEEIVEKARLAYLFGQKHSFTNEYKKRAEFVSSIIESVMV
ncbi:glycosyltransferase [Actinomyces vulturis]|uniref:glycosyltransferase n=1 Tax=Actinomyces vulturis TaxID=1857645 RepID=UPI00082E23F8|nr:glycosyltransferase [Actinomyces vulturis]